MSIVATRAAVFLPCTFRSKGKMDLEKMMAWEAPKTELVN